MVQRYGDTIFHMLVDGLLTGHKLIEGNQLHQLKVVVNSHTIVYNIYSQNTKAFYIFLDHYLSPSGFVLLFSSMISVPCFLSEAGLILDAVLHIYTVVFFHPSCQK